MSDYLSPQDIAEETGLSLSTVYRALEAGELPGTKIRNRWVTLRSQLEQRVLDERTPRPRRAEDPMPQAGRARRPRGSVRSKVVSISERRAS